MTISVRELQAAARKARASGNTSLVKDAPRGLMYRVAATGTISAQFRYTLGGNERRMTLGRVALGDADTGGLTLAQVRAKHATALASVRDGGRDVAAEHLAHRAAARDAMTVGDLVEEFGRVYLATKPAGGETLRLLNRDLVPALGPVPVEGVRRRDVILLVDRVRERAPIVANRLLGATVRAFNFATDRGIIESHPLNGIKRPKEPERQRAMTDAEISAFLAAVDGVDLALPTARALRTILATAARPGEVAGMTADEIRGDVWKLPASRSKTNTAREIPLSAFALDAIRPALEQSSKAESPFVFTGTPAADGTHRPIDRHSLSRALLRKCRLRTDDDADDVKLIAIAPATPHDLRRSAATCLARLGVEPWTVEVALGHKLPGTATASTYNTHRYDREVRAALDALGHHLRSLADGR